MTDTTNQPEPRDPAVILGELIEDSAVAHGAPGIGTIASYNIARDLLASDAVRLTPQDQRGPTLAQTFPFGEFLDEELTARKIPRRMLRRPLGLNLSEIDDLIEGRRELTRDLADRLGGFLGTSAELWLNLDRIHKATQLTGDTAQPGGDVIEQAAKVLHEDDWPGADWDENPLRQVTYTLRARVLAAAGLLAARPDTQEARDA